MSINGITNKLHDKQLSVYSLKAASTQASHDKDHFSEVFIYQ